MIVGGKLLAQGKLNDHLLAAIAKNAGMHRTMSARKWSGACMGIAILRDLGPKFESECWFGDGVSCCVGPDAEAGNVD